MTAAVQVTPDKVKLVIAVASAAESVDETILQVTYPVEAVALEVVAQAEHPYGAPVSAVVL